MFEVEYQQLDSTNESNKYVILGGIPLTADNVALDTIGGTAQALDGDFAIVDGTKVTWNGLGLDTTPPIMVDGQYIRIIYDRS
jgi:hypothetical protein